MIEDLSCAFGKAHICVVFLYLPFSGRAARLPLNRLHTVSEQQQIVNGNLSADKLYGFLADL